MRTMLRILMFLKICLCQLCTIRTHVPHGGRTQTFKAVTPQDGDVRLLCYSGHDVQASRSAGLDLLLIPMQAMVLCKN